MALNNKRDVKASVFDETVPAEAPVKKSISKNDVISQIQANDPGFDWNAENVEPGADSDAISYVIALGDPSVSDSVKLKDDNGNKVEHTFPLIVGYRFRANKDIQVPDFGTTAAFGSNNLMNAENVTNWREVKAGEEFDLTRLEVAALLTLPQYCMRATGNPEMPVSLALRYSGLNPNKVPTSTSELPAAMLKVDLPGSSIKTAGILEVLDYVSLSSKENKFAAGKRTMKPEFENTKFANLAIVGVRRSGSRSEVSDEAKKQREKIDSAKSFSILLSKLAQKQG